jgi:hypothetical protein
VVGLIAEKVARLEVTVEDLATPAQAMTDHGRKMQKIRKARQGIRLDGELERPARNIGDVTIQRVP